MFPTIKTSTIKTNYLGAIMNVAAVGCTCILICLTSSAHAQTCAPPTCFVNGSAEIECNFCPLGFGVAVQNRELMLCSSSPPRNTKCEPCIAGVNFSDTNDSQSKCLGCQTCHTAKEVQSKDCTVVSNRECICKEGLFYFNDELNSCAPCAQCGEDEEETEPCTLIKDRECGPRRAPATVTGTSLPPTSNQTTPPTIITNTPDAGMSTDDRTNGNSLAGGWIALISISLVTFFIVIIVAVWKCRKGTCTGQNSGGSSFYTINCCIGRQTNNTSNGNATAVQMNGHAQRDNPQYHQVPSPTGSEPNGFGSELNHASRSTSVEMECQPSIAESLEFSTEKLELLIRKLDAPDPLNRNAVKLANENLEMSQSTRSMLDGSSTQASDVLKMWVEQGKTREDLIQALKDMERGDIAEFCERDSSGS